MWCLAEVPVKMFSGREMGAGTVVLSTQRAVPAPVPDPISPPTPNYCRLAENFSGQFLSRLRISFGENSIT